VTIGVSRETAELCLTALGMAARQAAPKRNGLPVPPHWLRAIGELEDVVREADGSAGGTRPAVPGPVVAPFELIDVATAASRLGVSARAVRGRLERGRLPGRKVGPVWLVEWRPTDGSDRDG
jgi:hypothetical protein